MIVNYFSANCDIKIVRYPDRARIPTRHPILFGHLQGNELGCRLSPARDDEKG
jgi:hypothetical protein